MKLLSLKINFFETCLNSDFEIYKKRSKSLKLYYCRCLTSRYNHLSTWKNKLNLRFLFSDCSLNKDAKFTRTDTQITQTS